MMITSARQEISVALDIIESCFSLWRVVALRCKEYEARAAYRRQEARRMSSEGTSFKEIATHLGVSAKTVQGYVYAPHP